MVYLMAKNYLVLGLQKGLILDGPCLGTTIKCHTKTVNLRGGILNQVIALDIGHFGVPVRRAKWVGQGREGTKW